MPVKTNKTNRYKMSKIILAKSTKELRVLQCPEQLTALNMSAGAWWQTSGHDAPTKSKMATEDRRRVYMTLVSRSSSCRL
jgi:hypothetical protein